MNETRRKLIREATKSIQEASDKASQIVTLRDEIDALIETARENLETAKDEEQEYLDNMPESLRDGDKGGVAQEAIDNLDSAIDTLDGATSEGDYDGLNEAADVAEQACG